MNNKSLAVKISIQTLSDAIAALVYRHILISPASYERFGDKNRITPGLRKMWLAPAGKGRSLDLIAQDIKAYEQFSFLEEDEIIEAIIDFTESHDSAKNMESYLKERIASQQIEKAAIDRKLTRVPVDSEDIQCYVDHALAILPKPELQKEAQDFIKSPNLYFGPLLEVERCKEDLFDLPQNQQIKVVESILIATKNRPAYLMRSKTRTSKVTSINKALTRKEKPAAKKTDNKYVDPAKAPAYYFYNRETLKLEFHTSKTGWEKLDPALKNYIKRNALFSRPKSAWVSKARYENAYYFISELKRYGIPEAAPQGERSTFEERLNIHLDRADKRSERYSVKADKTRDEAYKSQERAVDMLRVIPMGQPILVGHHSERGHRRLIQKSDDAMRRGVQGEKKADYYDQRAITAQITARAKELKDRGFLMRRIEDNEKIIQKFQKKWKPGTYETRTNYIEATEKLAFYQRKLEELKASGVAVASKEVLKKAKATHIKDRFGWYEIVRINEKTVTVKSPYSWTNQVSYDAIVDWKPKAENKPAKAPRKEKVTRLKKGVKQKKVAAPAKPKSTAKAKAGRKAATTMKKVKAVQVARASKRATVKAPVKKVTKASELKKQREKAGRELKKGLSPVGVIKIGRVINSTYRTPGAQLRDNPVTHKKVLAPTEENLKKWINRPGKYDLVGVDTGSQTVTIRKKKEGTLDTPTKKFLKNK